MMKINPESTAPGRGIDPQGWLWSSLLASTGQLREML
jgi:hypothetical protein